MQTLTRTYMVVIEGFDHMTTMEENMNCTKLTHLLSFLSLNLRALFHASIFPLENLIAFLDVHTRVK